MAMCQEVLVCLRELWTNRGHEGEHHREKMCKGEMSYCTLAQDPCRKKEMEIKLNSNSNSNMNMLWVRTVVLCVFLSLLGHPHLCGGDHYHTGEQPVWTLFLNSTVYRWLIGLHGIFYLSLPEFSSPRDSGSASLIATPSDLQCPGPLLLFFFDQRSHSSSRAS